MPFEICRNPLSGFELCRGFQAPTNVLLNSKGLLIPYLISTSYQCSGLSECQPAFLELCFILPSLDQGNLRFQT